MVFFTCNLCGSPLKKNQVDKHIYQCRTRSVSCMDCQKDFGTEEYASHTKCVSEAEKYGGGDWKAPSNFNKGEKKQQAWVDTVNEALKNSAGKVSPPARSLLQTLAKHDNVPRKRAKFLNFINNIARNRFDSNTLEQVWNLLDGQWKAQAEATKNQKSQKEDDKMVINQMEEVETEMKPKKKKKKDSRIEESPQEDLQTVENQIENFETDMKPKKKKKNKKDSQIKESLQNGHEIVNNETEDLEAEIKKPKKKKRKKKDSEIEESSQDDQQIVISEKEEDVEMIPKKKKKRTKVLPTDITSLPLEMHA